MKQYFWSYNMPTHWRRAHSQQPMPPALCQEIEDSTEELARLETLKQPKLSELKREERKQRKSEKSEAAKLARLAEQEEAQPLGRGHRVAAARAAAEQ